MRDEVEMTVAHIAETIGEPRTWKHHPGGWPGDIEAALVDAVFSARAVYQSRRGRGVHAQVVAWRGERSRSVFTLDALLSEIDALGVEQWATQFGNHQVSPGRAVTAPNGPSKAAAVHEAAHALVNDLSVSTADQITYANAAAVRRSLGRVPGIGYATVNYFLMLLGRPGVKPDRMIHRFLRDALGRELTNEAAEQVVSSAAQQLGVQTNELDHAIWSYESALARG